MSAGVGWTPATRQGGQGGQIRVQATTAEDLKLERREKGERKYIFVTYFGVNNVRTRQRRVRFSSLGNIRFNDAGEFPVPVYNLERHKKKETFKGLMCL